jgi:hypothetical protein
MREFQNNGIFLSRSHQDKVFVNRLGKGLRAKGVRVWTDDREIELGDSFLDKISATIQETDYVGAILSKNPVNSNWVQFEFMKGNDYGNRDRSN